MAVTGYTSDDLLTRVKARGQIPAADDRLSDADILAMADDAIRSTVGRIVWNADDGRAVRTQADVALVSGVSDYRLPDRAVGSAVYDVLLVDSAGNERSSRYVDPAEAWRWRSDDGVSVESDRVFAHTIEGDTIRLLPTPESTDLSLRVKYRRRPSRLVKVAECALLASGDPGLFGTTAPASWGATLDLDYVRSAPGGDALADDISTSNGGSSLIPTGLANSGPYLAEVGDYACLPGETCVLPVPEEAVPFLTALVTFEAVAALGDASAAAALQALVAGRRRELIALVDDRNREDEAIIPRTSHLRFAGRTRRLGWD